MAATEVSSQPPTRKLSVVDTLDQARRALSTHRQWLKRQVSSEGFGVQTVKEDEAEVSNWTVADVENEEVAQYEEQDHGNADLSGVARAPPTLLPVSQGPVRTAQSARQWIEFLQQKRIMAKVSPAPVLESVAEEEEGEGGGDSHSLSASQRQVTWATGEGSPSKEKENQNFGEKDKSQELLQHRRSKTKWVSKATVFPAVSSSPPNSQCTSTDSAVPTHLFTSPTSPVPPASDSVPAPMQAKILAAWGSLSSLDNYMESLETGTQKEDDRKAETPTSQPSDLALKKSSVSKGAGSVDRELEEVDAATPSGENRPHSSEVTSHPSTWGHSPNAEDRLRHAVTADTAPVELVQQHPATATESPKETSADAVDIAALQSRSSATILPVSPAPKDQQSSYEAHLHSKLEQVGMGLKVVEEKGRSSTPLESESQVRITSAKKRLSVGRSTASPDAVLEAVLPYQAGRNSDITVSAAGPVSEPQKPVNQLVTDDESNPPLSSAQLQQTPDMSESRETIKASSDHASPALNRTGTMPPSSKTSKQKEDTSDLSFHPQLTSTPSLPAGGGHGKTERVGEKKKKILKELDLPPLKDSIKMIGARSILSGLPRLKSQTPPSPPNTTFSSELKLSRKRSWDPPSYTTRHHTTAGLALNPPCPRYGVTHPEEASNTPLQRRRHYSTPSPSVLPSPPNSPLSLHSKRKTLHSATKRGSIGATSSDGEQVDAGMMTDIPTSPVRKKITADSPKDLRKHAELQKAVSYPGAVVYPTGFAGPLGEGIGGEGREELAAPASPLLQGQSVSEASGKTSGRIESSVYHMQSGPGPLHLAAKAGNLRRLQSLLAEGHNINTPDHEGRTPLMYCIHSRGVHLSCADLLIREGANLDKQSSDGSTVIHLASTVGAVSLIELAILNNANPDIRDFEGRLPLHWATLPLQSSKCAVLLLKHSTLDINTVDDAGMTPLMWAAYNNNPLVTAFLLSQGADCEEKDMDGFTAMHWAVHRDGIRCLERLLKADQTYFKDHKGRTVLHHAAEVGSIAACELVLGLRADAVHDLDRMGRTPLHYGAACSRVDVCALLLDRGSDASQKDLTGKTAVEYARMKKLDYVVALLTCHETAVADFARVSRSTSVSSLLNRATSFSQLPISSGEVPANQDIISESLQPLPGNKKGVVKDPGSSCKASDGRAGCDSSLPYTGAFLGRFVQDKNDPLQHFFFWLTAESLRLSWSRERDRRRVQEAVVYDVQPGPSQLLRQNAAYSPDELHTHVFWVMTDSGVLDLLAYNEDTYQVWVNEIGKIAQGPPKVIKHPQGGQGKPETLKLTEAAKPTQGGPKRMEVSPREPNKSQIPPQRKTSHTTSNPKRSLRLKTKRSAAVGPALVVENEASDSAMAAPRRWADISAMASPPGSDSEVELKASSHVKSNKPSRTQGSPLLDDTFIDDII